MVGAYYRAPWEYAQEESVREGLRRMCVLIGRSGACSDLLAVVGELQHTVKEFDINRDTEDSLGTSGMEEQSKKGSIRAIQYLAGGWMALSFSLLGLAASPEEKIEMEKEQAPCALCGKQGPVRRCTKCLGVSYCSRAHQQAHWKAHKADCLSASARGPSASLFGDKERSSLLKQVNLPDAVPEEGTASWAVVDIPDPFVLLSSQRLAREIDKANRGPLAPARRTLESVCRAAVVSIRYHLPILYKEPEGVKRSSEPCASLHCGGPGALRSPSGARI